MQQEWQLVSMGRPDGGLDHLGGWRGQHAGERSESGS
jgi:hypothetical protein